MLVAVLMFFVVFSYTGVAVLNVSYLSFITSQETVDNIKLQYALENQVSEALWRINNGTDSLVNVSNGGITTIWEASSSVLTINVDMFEMESEILLDLSEDFHFTHGIATSEEIITNEYDPVLDEDHLVKDGFHFLPEVDLQYFIDHAVSISNKPDKFKKSGKHGDSNTLIDGIHVFTGNGITIEDLQLDSGTLVFTGKNIRFRGNNVIMAPPADSTGVHPALIFTNHLQTFEMYSDDGAETIIGAIYCRGSVELHNGNISGPVIANTVTLGDDINFLDDEHPEFYQWTHGFGEREDYDWPKRIKRWTNKKWNRKHNQT